MAVIRTRQNGSTKCAKQASCQLIYVQVVAAAQAEWDSAANMPNARETQTDIVNSHVICTGTTEKGYRKWALDTDNAKAKE
eukprot:6364966-Karenia_brevis.AAC.1